MPTHRGKVHNFDFTESEMVAIWNECHQLDSLEYPTLWKFIKEIGEHIEG